VTHDTRGVAVLGISELHAYDSAGRALEASFATERDSISIRVDVDGAVYPVVIDPLIATLQAELTASTRCPRRRARRT
jgi:hypothetical protein